jgi:hypothetical protein
LRAEGQFVAHVTFLARKNAFPGHAQWHMLRRPREGMEQHEGRCAEPSFSNGESIHFGRHGLRVEASCWKADAFPPGVRTLSIMLCRCVLLLYLVYSAGRARGRTRGRSPGRPVLYTEGPPRSTGAAPPRLLSPVVNLKARTAVATQREHANLAASAGKVTLSEMRRFNASSHCC